MGLAVLVVMVGITKKFKGDTMNKRPTLNTINDTVSIISGMYTIYTTIICIDPIAGGTLGVETGNPTLLYC
ncbi:MAG: hypothetical protein AB1604_03550 [Euryarchaeota archaeon]